MTRKRFAFHDTSVQSDDSKVIITCSRCPATSTVNKATSTVNKATSTVNKATSTVNKATSTVNKDGSTDPVYRALMAIDRQPCAEVELDENGLPMPVR